MVPLTGIVDEFKAQRDHQADHPEGVAEKNDTIEYRIGTMIEIPRACPTADNIAKRQISSRLARMTSPR